MEQKTEKLFDTQGHDAIINSTNCEIKIYLGGSNGLRVPNS